MLLLIPRVVSSIFIVDVYGNTVIIDVYDIEVIYVDLEALYYEMLLCELAEAFESFSRMPYNDDWSFGFGRDNVVPFGDYRNSRYPW